MRAALIIVFVASALASCIQHTPPKKMDWGAMLDEAGILKQVTVR